MARGIFKGRPSPAVQTDRLRILAQYGMSAREIFEERREVLLRARAAAAKAAQS